MSHTKQNWQYFVWMKTNGRVSPQIWGEDYSDRMEKGLCTIVAKFKLKTEDQGISLTELKKRYPLPENGDA